jgi:hypothetical protein
MRLASVRLVNLGPFSDTALRFAPEGGSGMHEGGDEPNTRATTIVFGGDGTGKTSLLSALALTRPGYALPPMPTGSRGPEPSFAVAEWHLGEDDPERPHPLLVASPSAVLPDETAEAAAARRREQALFDRKAQQEGGFVFVAFSGARWFSRTPNMLTTPEKSIVRYDVRHAATFDDPSRADLTRETKQVLAYAAIARALGEGRAEHAALGRFEEAIREVATVLLAPFGCTYAGVSPITLEPEAKRDGKVIPFDALPRAARHLLAFGALPLRALFAAYPGSEVVREREAVVVIDDIEAHQDPALLRAIPPLLRNALPNVQWILTTASTQLAMATPSDEVVALRRMGESQIEIGEGTLH